MAEEVPDCPQGTLARYRALLEISELINAHRRFEDFFRELGRSLSRIIPFEGVGLSIYDTARKTTFPNEKPLFGLFQNEDYKGSSLTNLLVLVVAFISVYFIVWFIKRLWM